MEFSIKSGAPDKQRIGCVAVGVFEHRKLSEAAKKLDAAAAGHLAAILRGGDMDGKLGTTLLLPRVPDIFPDRVLLVGLGKEREFREKPYQTAIAAAVERLASAGGVDASIHLSEIPVRHRGLDWNIEQALRIAHDKLYRFDATKSEKNEERHLKRLTFIVSRRGELAEGEAGFVRGQAIAAGMTVARDLGNLPPNVCTPTYLAEQAQALAKAHGFKCTVLDQAGIEKLGMGSFLSVAKGSRQPPRFIVLEYKGAGAAKPVVLVGKGITFDAGGISLKPAAEMDEMKYDMSGAGSVLGTFRALGDIKPKVNVIGLVPTCENLPDGLANKPGDIVTSLSGQTIEVLNTDAEGRLILCDALTYAERFEPQCVVDIATLTGACVIALGHHATGLLGNNDGLMKDIERAAESAQDRVWRLPLWDDYQEQLKSNFADMANIGGRAGGTITAACFLSRFAKKYDWAHLDIAGTAWKSGKEKGSTGRPVPLLTHFVLSRAA
jgi:leucyl aminopeptidase